MISKLIGAKALKTTAGVLSAFRTTIAELESVAQQHAVEAARQRDMAQAAVAAAEQSEQEVKQADAVRAKLAALLA